MRSRKDKVWMVRWQLMGCPTRLPDDMFATVPKEVLYHTKTRLPLNHGAYFHAILDKDGLICLQKWAGVGYRLAFTDDTGEEHTHTRNSWKEAKAELVRILGHG